MTRKEAIKQANIRRAAGEAVKIFEHRSTYTQPGRGMVAFIDYKIVKTVTK